jgi:hypothetical protein
MVDKRIIDPFNAWWRIRNHCEPNLLAITAFEAGYMAALDAVKAVLPGRDLPTQAAVIHDNGDGNG